jgi:hypothetical protein
VSIGLDKWVDDTDPNHILSATKNKTIINNVFEKIYANITKN